MSEHARIDLEVAAGPIGDAVIRRVVAAGAAQSRLPIDRINDAILAVDALLGALAAARLCVTIIPLGAGIDIAIGPTDPEEAERLLNGAAAGGVGVVVRGLSERVWIDGDREHGRRIAFRVGRGDSDKSRADPDPA